MKMTVFENDLVVSTEEIKGFIFGLTLSDNPDGNYIGIGQNDTMSAVIYHKEIPLANGKSMLLETRHSPDLQPLYDIMDGYKGMVLVDIQHGTTRVMIEW